MRILHIADRLTDRGGAYTWMLGVLAGLVDAGHRVRLVVGVVSGDVAAPCPVDLRPGLESRSSARAELDPLLRTLQPDVIHVHNVMNPEVLEWAADRTDTLLTVQDHRYFCPIRGKWTGAGAECRDPMSEEVCGPCVEDPDYFRDIFALTERRLAAVRRMEAVTVLSRYVREELTKVGVSSTRVRVVPPFVHDLDQMAERRGEPCVLYVGRLAAAKGVEDAVEAWRRSGVDLPLVLAGSGPLRDALETRAREDPPGRMEVVGWVDRERLSSLYRRARALLFPSRWQEPYGIVGIEALSFGVPVVAWESGAVSEWHPGPGLVPWGDVDALAFALTVAVKRRITRPFPHLLEETIARLLAQYGHLAHW